MTSWPARLWGAFYMAYHRLGQARYPFRPLSEIIADRERRVRRMAAYAYRTVPYYRETMRRLGLTPHDFQSADDLAKLPILERGDFQRDLEYMTSTAAQRERGIALRNSGTTGRPCTFYFDERALLQDAAFGERARAAFTPLLGRSLGYRLSAIVPGPRSTFSLVQQFLASHAFLPRGLDLRRQYLFMTDPPEANARLLNEFRPDVIQSYGSYIAELFGYLKASGAPFHRPKVVRYTSDGLPDSIRRVIEQEFGIPVFSRYDANEMSNIGFECARHRGLHLNIDYAPLRIVDDDGRTLPPGEPGEVIVSNLLNRATVILNYRLGDLATLLPDPCPCGRSLPLLSAPQGRREDWLLMPSGRRLHPQTVHNTFRYHQNIQQFQIEQEAPNRFRISAIVLGAFDPAEKRERLRADLIKALGEPVEVEVQFVKSIPRTPGGKVRTVISLVAGPAG